ncbi:hypothetical protein IAD21_06326 [Abditibacteriota bacterium]|nr:hypothetical protein IAD21_06326 [Abditibacteriota bacterium]
MKTTFALYLFAGLVLPFGASAFAAPTSWPGWVKMPLLPPQAKAAGVFPGGEGSQWPRGPVVISQSDPNFLLLPIDVGGLYRSLDGGAHWNIAMTGWSARGANGFAIDPRNSSHVLGIGGNGMDWGANWGQSPHGVYLSDDKADSWEQVLAVLDGVGGVVTFDPMSFDAAKKQCMRAYFLSAKSGLFRSEDGGRKWTGVANGIPTQGRVDRDWTQGGTLNSQLKVDATGTVFIAGAQGVWTSRDQGVNWSQIRTVPTYGLELGNDGAIYVSGDDKISISRDAGKNFSALACAGIETSGKPVQNIAVSPVDPKRMLCWVAGDNWKWVRYTSQDGGQTFAPIKVERGLAGRDDGAGTSVPGGFATLPLNVRNGYFAWHPTNPNIAYGLGGDWVTRSTDGGKTFAWWNNGYNGIMLGASFNFAAQDPKSVFLGFQDYNAANTTDGGQTWTYRDASGKGWGGHCYGASQSTDGVMWYGDAEGWGDKRRLRISRDGGQTWNFAQADGSNCEWSGADVSFVSPKNAAILFASNWRSTDKGISWQKMASCDGVYSAALDGTLFGKKGNALVKSSDDGANWQQIADVAGGFRDVAYDARHNRFYLASEDRLKRLDKGVFADVNLPLDQMGNGVRAETVAVDAGAPDVMYVGGARDIYASASTIVRSRDGGTTWENLSVGDGPHEVAWVRINPQTGDAWLNGQCYGMWRIARPTALGVADTAHGNATRRPDVPLAVPVALSLGAPASPPITVRNGDMAAGTAVPDGWDQHWGDVTTARDTQIFHSTPASLRVEANGKSGQGFQMFDVAGGGTYTISGWVKTQGDVKVNVAVQSFAGDWSKNDFNQVKYLQNDFDWQQFSKEVAIPAWAGRFNVQLMVEGTGRAWLDDIQVTPKGVAPVAANGEATITNTIADLGGRNFDYAYGDLWKLNENVTTGNEGGTNFVQIDATEHGGVGLVLNGANLVPQSQTHLALRARRMAGNSAATLAVNLVRADADGGAKTVSFDLSKLNEQTFTTLLVPLPEGDFSKVQQVQMQGTNWGGGALPLKLQIDALGTTTPDPKLNAQAQIAHAATPTGGPAPKDRPDVAGWGFYADYPQAWMSTHNSFLERTKQGREKKDINIVFLGDSITQGWGGEGKSLFEALYAPKGAVNYGIGGDSTRQVLWRITNGELDGLAPKLVVLKIGTNNLYGDNNSGSDEEIAAGITKIVQTIREKLPQTRVLLLGILPRQNDYFSNRAKNINALISKLDDGRTVRFLDMSDKFQTEIGKVKPELYVPDQLDLAKPGYQVWADTMQPLFDAMLK